MTGTGNRVINIDAPVTIGNITRNWAANGVLTFSGGAITLAGTNPTITNNDVGAQRRMEFTNVLNGTDGLTIAGGGMVTVTTNATNNYTGATLVTGGSFLNFEGSTNANIGGGASAGRNITVEDGSTIRFNALSNAFLNRIVETTDEIFIATGPANATASNTNDLDFSSSTGANLPNAFLASWSSNNAPTRYYGTITPASDNYRLGGPYNPPAQAFQVGSLLTGTQGLIVGGGSVVLSNSNNDFTGETVVRDGARLGLGKLTALQNSALNTDTGSLTFLDAATGNLADRELVNAPTLGGLVGSRNLSAMYSTATLNNTGQVTTANVLGITLNPGTGETHTYGGNVALNSTMYLTKTGEGTQILNGINTYTGETLVNAGTLIINGSTSTGNVTVASGATLGGSGTVGGAITVNNGGTLSPGNSAGQFTVGNSLTLAASSSTQMELGGTTLGTTYDNITIDIAGALAYGGNLNVENLGLYDMDLVTFTYDLFALNGVTPTGDFASVTVNSIGLFNSGGLWTGTNGDVSYSFAQSTGDLTITAIPEPAAALLGGLGLLALLRRRRA